jgi:hypothetical protein
VPNTAQDGFVRQAAAVAGSSNAVARTVRCEIAMNAASASGRSAQKTSWNRAGSIDTSTLPSGTAIRVRRADLAGAEQPAVSDETGSGRGFRHDPTRDQAADRPQ